jgi:hypothetical protein
MEPVTNYDKSLWELLSGPVKRGIVEPVTNLFNQRAADTGRQLSRDETFSPNWPQSREGMRQEGIYLQDPGSEQGQAMDAVIGGMDIADMGAIGLGTKAAKQVGQELLKALPKAKRDKEFLGYPEWVKSKRDITKLRKQLRTAADLGQAKRHWYKDSGEGFLDATQGDLDRASQLGNFSALTSANTDVFSNMGHGSRMYYQNLMGDRLAAGQFPNNMGKDADRWLKEGEAFIGKKRNPFFTDIMGDLDPSLPQDTVTNDVWMSRMFGNDKDTLGIPNTRVMTSEVQRLAKELGWKPRETQAAIWSTIKGQWESVQDAVKAKGKKKGWGPEKLRREIRKTALKADIPPDVLNEAGYSFREALADQSGHIGWEAIPSFESRLMPEIHGASYEVRQQFTADIEEALGNEIEKELGILMSKESDSYGVGFYDEGGKQSYNPSKQIGVVIPMGPGGQASGKIDPSARNAIELYAAIRGKLTNQHTMGYGRAFNVSKSDAATKTPYKNLNHYQIDIGREFSPEESEHLMDLMENHPYLQEADKSGNIKAKVWFAPSKNGIKINHDRYDTDHTKFIRAVEEVIQKDDFMPDMDIKGFRASFDGGLIGGDELGSTYDSIIRRNGGEAKERTLTDRLGPKLKEVYRSTAKKHGFKDPYPETVNPKSVGDRLSGGPR